MTALDRLHALLLAITGPDGCDLEGADLDAYLATCLDLAVQARAAQAPAADD